MGEVARFVQHVLHGDRKHRQWLLDAAEAFESDKEIPAVKGRVLTSDDIVLTEKDQIVVRMVMYSNYPIPVNQYQFQSCVPDDWFGVKECKERDECLDKLIQLGIVKI